MRILPEYPSDRLVSGIGQKTTELGMLARPGFSNVFRRRIFVLRTQTFSGNGADLPAGNEKSL